MIVLSLGAGVQSSTLLMMADAGEFPAKPDFAIFADTGAEPAEVHEYLRYLQATCSIPIVTVQEGDYEAHLLEREDNDRLVSGPFHADRGLLPRQCTYDYKIKPIRQYLAQHLEALNLKKEPGSVDMWLGISWDEIQRVKPANVQWITHHWPLVDKRMTRTDCSVWMKQNGHPAPPRSACVFCPLMSDERRAEQKENQPVEFERACRVDEKIRHLPKLQATAYVHRSHNPLREVDFVRASRDQLFFDECEGFCHV